MSLEETTEELTKNVVSLGFDLEGLIRRKKLAMDYVRVERSEIETSGNTTWKGCLCVLTA
jgi:circadian clock protein KaiC